MTDNERSLDPTLSNYMAEIAGPLSDDDRRCGGRRTDAGRVL